jgi:hypothetical protein
MIDWSCRAEAFSYDNQTQMPSLAKRLTYFVCSYHCVRAVSRLFIGASAVSTTTLTAHKLRLRKMTIMISGAPQG